VALLLLDTLDSQHARLAKPNDAEALHDFRVALRRLRSWLRAYRSDIKDSVGKKAMRRLGVLAGASTDSRDIEVHLEWLAAQTPTLTATEKRGAGWLKQRFTVEKRRADAGFREALGTEFGELSAKLRKNLSRYGVAVWDQQPDDRWALTAATKIHEAFVDFRRRLMAVEEIRSDEELHRARIAGKRLRYLIEPLVGVVEGAAEVVESLKRFPPHRRREPIHALHYVRSPRG
jgi:CHAD domain-containing protein